MSAFGDTKMMGSSWSDAPPSYTRLRDLPPDPVAVASSSGIIVDHAAPAGGQQTSVVVVNAGAPSVIYQPAPLVQSFSCHICLACFTFWCCGVLFGLVAFILAVVAQSHSTSMNPVDRKTAHTLGKWSIGMSLFGMLVGLVITIAVVCLTVTTAAAAAAAECDNGRC